MCSKQLPFVNGSNTYSRKLSKITKLLSSVNSKKLFKGVHDNGF